ncbi:hypothetical protein GQ53DRAFT_811462 [Thozetella sp. PMI_491]|nr:hypothetical protein GQ53DRAFT_811462 [Thozetella sp. PMI_491]
MPSPQFAGAQARASCHRCHRRKKKCDRVLPQCGNCKQAHIACSFLDDDSQVGSYPVAFVRSLENRIRELESLHAASRSSTNPALPDLGDHTPPPTESTALDSGRNGSHADTSAFLAGGGIDTAEHLHPDPGISHAPSSLGSLFDEIKILSGEATGERHLGSTSGFSFARLTQAVLRRLSPDKADFVFANDAEGAAQQLFEFDSPSDALNSIFHTLDGSLTCYPTLFGEFSLSDLTESDDVLTSLSLPGKSRLDDLVDFYFAHSHTLYPIVHHGEFLSTLGKIYSNPHHPLAQSPLHMFRIWMVLAIGSTTHCSVMLSEESEPILYYNKAMVYFEAAFGFGDMAALEVLMLQVSYSFFNQLGPNTWFLIGLAARMAVGLGLHTASTYESLPTDVAERRKRVFFSIYMMDRVASMALGRPFALHDDDIDVTPFVDADDENITPDGINPRNFLQPSLMAVPLHILQLRRIASKISREVYSHTKAGRAGGQEQREETLRQIHKELIEWRRNMPFPLPDIHPLVPHLTTSWYDFNFYSHLTMLYRPSPLFPTLDRPLVRQLADAAAMSIRQAITMHRQRRLAYNWLNLLSVFTSTLSLIYAVTAQPDDLAAVLKETKAIDNLEEVTQLFDTLSMKFAAAGKIRRMLQQIVGRYKELCNPDP